MPRLTSDPHTRRPPRFAYLRSCLPVIGLLLIFSFFLSSLSLLSHFRSPANKQRLGWQAWDVVKNQRQQQEVFETGNSSNPADTTFVPSIPLDNWASPVDFLRASR